MVTDPEGALRHEDDTEAAIVVPAQQPAVPAQATKSATQKAQETALNAYRLVRLILLILLGFIIALFVVRNWEDVSLDYVIGDSDMPLAVVMLIFTAIGVGVGMLIYWFLARRTRK